MPAAPAANAPVQPDPAADEATVAPSRSGILLGLIRRLIDIGRELTGNLRGRSKPDYSTAIAFGTADLALILRRIKLGLLRAAALEARVSNTAVQFDAKREPVLRDAKPARSRSERSAAPRAAARDPQLAVMPSVEEIAAEVARRPIGAVLADICRDIGIMPGDPIWRELNFAIMEHGGDPNRLLCEMLDRPSLLDHSQFDESDLLPLPSWALPLPQANAATGPP